jgi:hypothetical protein
MPDGPPSESTTPEPGRWRRVLFHPLMALPAFIVLTQELEERCYPFSHFPMYSNPVEWDDYIYLTDATGTVVGTNHHTGLSASKLNKTFNRKMKDAGLRSSASRRNADPVLESKAGAQVLEWARQLAERRKRPLPRPVRLMRVIIERRGDALVETPHMVAEG